MTRMSVVLAFGQGVVAGLAIAVPLGGIGVLLISEGVRRGWRGGLPAAAAVALVDLSYCLVAVMIGSVAASFVARIEPWPTIGGGIALVVVAAFGLYRGLRRYRGLVCVSAECGESLRRVPRLAAGGPACGRMTGGELYGASGTSRFIVFLGLTAINPVTVVYFVALSAAMTSSFTTTEAAAFISGTGVGSFAWQVCLIAVGGVLHTTMSPKSQRITVFIGNAICACLGLYLLISVWT